ncbi:Folylpolyglutamate synthase [Pyrenophora seminiperda CCB06]|uniref:Folylpolyglutamate synthase n=1 Tax=Pyrenophora seminiperda CCB06 TaxID=1302712 RepID=A0A3M7M9H3_9PLEO|nr:Folylpolyglutamate synthase [Pyrenophora seminiperda CCB06]
MLTAYKQKASKPLKVGCLTSPHVTNVRERIRLDANPISEQIFAFYFFKMWEKMKNHHTSDCKSGPSLPGYPGFLALLGIYVLVKEKVDISIVETGVGGENDSTNVIPNPTVTGITTIGLDHVNVLGNSLSSIAWHKAGIFKQGSPAYTTMQEDSVLTVLQDRAREKRISGNLSIVPENLVDCYAVTVEPNMAFQRRNASLAIALVDSCLKALYPHFMMTPELARSIERTELPGRSQIVKTAKLVWYISCAHNEISIEVASKWYAEAVKHSK